ncbi:hypothetical protein [Mycobacterium sp. GA-2829]|uniref:DUF7002 family protein n=1 Tax=Mycobacterium sp. GA-2829 TaxID=1772283 RepID=UPI000740107D|nr:hypothetical protein [Mycobacterium sp. GA-2829]KUI36259.1 hypothetical protein AU194_16230 [Mycobacterium sp. GA-2829]
MAPYNTGNAHVPNAPKRGPETFKGIEQYPFEDWRRKRGRNGEAVVEFTVPWSATDLAKYVRQIELWLAD